jgi:hypothetical protein
MGSHRFGLICHCSESSYRHAERAFVIILTLSKLGIRITLRAIVDAVFLHQLDLLDCWLAFHFLGQSVASGFDSLLKKS